MGKNKYRYYNEIDIARGFCTILVVLGHVVTQGNAGILLFDKIFEIMGTIIYGFHMHVFFIISGFLGCKVINFTLLERKKYIIKRCSRLLIPYFTIGIIYIPFRVLLSKYSRTTFNLEESWKIILGQNPNGALWFLFTLSIITLIVSLIVSKKNINYLLFIGIILYFISFIYNVDLYIIKTLLIFPLFYLLGIKLKLNYEWIIQNLYKKEYIFIAALVFLVSSFIIIFKYPSVLSPFLTFSSIFLVMSISYKISENNYSLINILQLFGFYSMDVYIFSEPIKVSSRVVLNYFNIPALIIAVITFVLSLICPIIISRYIIRKNKILSLLFLGKI
ncbi:MULTISPECIES: acyltransferase family protein [Aerococcus]|uniref:acyltransferase family protein n=1 Tax=Aerococcus TaxID=1375 RepID=UPI000DCAFB68|nr:MULTISPECIES: acyltransferase [Aerococcus]KAA9234328.1 acyltransferase [Aerococcus mictus]MDK6292379.1 acyltransferase [Aerococcus urinae]MDK6374585.1 acyltransferase [Aerococcus urinae]MDK6420353.1 acyltransferase [Aerococcus urinae]MDK8075221.1 acyltransferase [Aerococcus urinae]